VHLEVAANVGERDEVRQRPIFRGLDFAGHLT